MGYHLQSPFFTMVKEAWNRKGEDLFSYLSYRLKWNLFPRLGYVSHWPLHVDIELTSRCNLQCTMCIQNSPEGRKNQGSMNFYMACHILEAIGGGRVYSVKFNWRGEPLLYGRLSELVTYAKLQGIPEVQINTNGLLLNVEFTKELVQAGLDRIIFSVDGHSSETYEKIRVGGNYRRIMTNIHNLLQEKSRRKAIRPFVRIQMVVGEDNQHEVPPFVEYWKRLGVQVALIDRQNRQKSLTRNGREGVPPVHCKQPWQRLTISWEGRVFPCCADWFESSPLLWRISPEEKREEIQKGLERAWKQGVILNQVRAALWSGELEDSLCSRCPFVINGKKKRGDNTHGE